MSTSDAPIRILVVDDNDASRFIKTQILRRAGYLVHEASTGQDGLVVARRERPDLAVLDVNLPDMSGYDVCRQLKQEMGSPTIQVLQVSQTAVGDDDRAKGLDEGADMYLAEPFGPSVLLATIRALLRVRQAEAELADALERERGARAEAERATRMKDDFVAMVSHELRTPLNAMTGWIWQLKRATLDEAGQRHAIEVLDRNARVQTQLINDLLDVARIAAGKLEIDLRPLSLQPIVTATVESVPESPAYSRKKITLDVRIAEEPVMVLGDAARLQQVVTNLLNNAFQFTPEGGTIMVECGSNEDQATIRIRDTGAGIDPGLLPHVFERFSQGRSLVRGPERGLGLGLAIVDYLVRQHGGRVALESPGVGRGTTCTVTLPVLDAAIMRPFVPPKLNPTILHGLRLLLVEDDADARDVLRLVLVNYGATVVTAATAEAGHERATAERFDVLVSDLGLPDFSGGELLRRIRASGDVTPAVAVTAFATEDDRRKTVAAGFLAHVAKPVDPEQLARTVAAAANRLMQA